MPLRVLIVELEGLLAEELARRLRALGATVSSVDALGVVERLLAEPPDLTVMNLELSHGSGFGVVNRVLRMEALAGLKIVLVAESATEAAIAAHAAGPTPAAAYVRRAEAAAGSSALADDVLAAAHRLLGEDLPEVPDADDRDLVEVEGRDGDAGGGDDARDARAGRDADSFAAVVDALGYRVLRRLRDEEGGAVFACMDDELHRAVAVKLMAPQGTGDDRERLLRFQRERRILALLRSPHVVAVYGAGTYDDIPYLVRELIDGESLAGQLAREGPLDVHTALQRVRETALGLKAAAAAGVIHRDVRPDHIYVVDGHAKLGRFGMGRRDAPDEARITQAGLPLRDLTYVAPERMRGQEDARGDIYALGVTLHALIAGAPPFTKSVPLNVLTGKRIEKPIALDEARPGTPPNVAALVTRLIAEDPEDRPQNYEQTIAALDDVIRAVTRDTAESATAVGAADAEPTAVLGTLRHMSVVEIVQSLELARKTATVSLPGVNGPDGILAFDAGRLTHASLGDLLGDEAFFALVSRRHGAFRVEYEPRAFEKNITTAATGLLLEAARRADEGGAAMSSESSESSESSSSAESSESESSSSLPEAATASRSSSDAHTQDASEAERAAAMAAVSGAALHFDFPAGADVDGPNANGATADVLTSTASGAVLETSSTQPVARAAPRMVPTWLGLVCLAATTALAVYGGFQVPPLLRADDVDDGSAAVPALLDKTRGQLREARAALSAAEPKLAAFEAEHASAESAGAAARKRSTEVQAILEAALKPELAAHRFSLRLDDGAEAVVEIGEGALFAGDGDEVIGDGKTTLARIAGSLATLDDLQIRVEGHTDDSEPRGRHRNNWGLSGARAMSVAKVLTEQGLPSSRVKAVALADTVPLSSNKGPKGRARNRRVELHLLPQLPR